MFANGKHNKIEPRFARIPTGPETCSFCIMLAGRGFVYHSSKKAGNLDHYHPGCDCRVAPSFDSVEVWTDRGGYRRLPATEFEGYDPDVMHRGYSDCVATIFDGRAISREKLLQTDEDTTRAILREMDTRDPEWLRTGKVPEVEYDSPDTEAWKTATKQRRKDHAQELETAKRLSKHGIKCVFVIDEKTVDKNGMKQTIGYADLEGGKELKSLREASSYNTIDSAIKNTGKKKDARCLYFDNSINDSMSDADLEAHILKCRRFKSGSIYIYGHDGQLRKIR